jgi:hypothetical protein
MYSMVSIFFDGSKTEKLTLKFSPNLFNFLQGISRRQQLLSVFHAASLRHNKAGCRQQARMSVLDVSDTLLCRNAPHSLRKALILRIIQLSLTSSQNKDDIIAELVSNSVVLKVWGYFRLDLQRQ